eukprot:TRINITY_DN10977_c1_g1_i1.p1 TRINITY_DN10977_c1_g1~~TRINITY_DN10977_c1_g1_i1.p1  ORF type:complete len:218 (+),score=107.99 TRINITY_DN10977_c1_g1_i1:68-655(+)
MQLVQETVQNIQKSSFQDLTTWKDPKATGVVFSSALVSFYFLLFLEYDVLTLSLRLFQLFMVGALIGSFLKIQVPAKDKETLENLLGSYTTLLSDFIVSQGSAALLVFNKVVRWEDKAFSGQVFFASIVASWLLNIFSVTSLIFLVWLGIFTIPAFFEKFKDAPWMVKAKDTVALQVKKVPALAKALGYENKKSE